MAARSLSAVCDDGWADGDIFMKSGGDSVKECFQNRSSNVFNRIVRDPVKIKNQ
jgi:hypothetical protein